MQVHTTYAFSKVVDTQLEVPHEQRVPTTFIFFIEIQENISFNYHIMSTYKVNSWCTVVIKLFSCSSQLSLKFKLLTNMKRAKINEILRFKSTKSIIYPANKC